MCCLRGSFFGGGMVQSVFLRVLITTTFLVGNHGILCNRQAQYSRTSVWRTGSGLPAARSCVSL